MEIDHTQSILLVDDDEFMLGFMKEMLGQHYPVVAANRPDVALEIMRQTPPALLLTDVRMPGMDGFALCETMKSDSALADVPVLFLSGLEGVNEHVRGYKVGGEDFVTKPVEPVILLAKVQRILESVAERRRLRELVGCTSSFAPAAAKISCMNETDQLLDSLTLFNQCADYPALAQVLLHALQIFDVQGLVQLLPSDAPQLVLKTNGQASELEVSVLNQLAGMERIVQFHDRLAINYPHLHLIITNMPLNDEVRRARLCNYLVVLVESAEARLHTLQLEHKSSRQGHAIHSTLSQLGKVLSDINHKQHHSRVSTLSLNSVLEQVESTLQCMGLTQQQKELIVWMIRDSFNELALARQGSEQLQDALSQAICDLKSVRYVCA